MKTWFLILLFFILCGSIVLIMFNNFSSAPIPQEVGTIEVYFCPQDNCEQQLLERISNANYSIHCAFFDLNVDSIINALSESTADVKVIIDKDNAEDISLSFIQTDTRSAYMHDKFCIFDNKEIFTGSMNPTITDAGKNNNNIQFITSKYLAENYEDEFNNMWQGEFGNDAHVKYAQILFNNISIENYFCPEDDCEDHIAEELTNAKSSIYFMQFSFTSDMVGDIILQKSKSIEVKGIFEKSQSSQYSEYEKLKSFSTLDASSGLLHHKVFIIDNETVITGSMNPSKNGNENNDENVLIIHDKEIAKMYTSEFEKLFFQ
ncbi:MAG: phospholipase D-like domain-containing protein [Candidatus Woesearchaeota archaeon]|jgi:phosphatidylserine/phosphatidylglycerophosphate/cardiolipin synthase-like enzyme